MIEVVADHRRFTEGGAMLVVIPDIQHACLIELPHGFQSALDADSAVHLFTSTNSPHGSG